MVTSIASPFKCDYPYHPTPPTPHILTSEQAELCHLNKQVNSLDSHISQLNMVRHALHDHLRQPHNQSSLTSHTPAIDVLSCICQQTINHLGESAAHTFECNHLHSTPLLIPNPLSSEQAESAYPSKTISLLDSQVSQLETLRHSLQHRAGQLHNRFSPIQTLPIEILSYIFGRINDSEAHTYPDLYDSRQCIRRALSLGSVSAHFRYVAFSTPELWKWVPLELRRTDPETTSKASALLQHCMTLAPRVNISVSDFLDELNARSAIEILLTPQTMQRIHAFQLYGSSCASHLWLDKLKGPLFPMLDVLNIGTNVGFDFETLKTVTRLKLSHHCRGPPLALPPSLQYLDVAHISERELVSFLYQCPNLVECFARVNPVNLDDNPQLNKPPALNHLKRLKLGAVDIVAQLSSAENFRLPKLEFLHLDYPRKSAITGIISFCRDLSTTLTTLIISACWEAFDGEYLYQLCKIPFPQLKQLEFRCTYFEFFQTAIRALARVDGECGKLETCHLPSLRSIILSCSARDTEPHSIVDLLKECRFGDAFNYHLVFEYPDRYHCWRIGLDEWRSNVGSRKIEITWGNRKVQTLCVQDGLLGHATGG